MPSYSSFTTKKPTNVVVLTALVGLLVSNAFTADAFTSTSSSFTPTMIRPNAFVPTTNSQQYQQQRRRNHLFMSSEAQAQPSPTTLLSSSTADDDEFTMKRAEPEDENMDLLEAVVNDVPTTSAITMTNTAASDNPLLDAVVFANGSVLAFVGTAVLYSLFHVHFEALWALWEYDLGQLDIPELTKAAVALDVMARIPVDWIHSYEALVPTHPIFYKACTSGVAYALGDFVSQVYQGKTLATLDLPRSMRSGAAGFIGHGPLCHYWLMFMETYLDFGGAWWATGIKVTADLTVWSIFLNAAYSLIIGTLAGRPPKEVMSDVKVTLWPALRSAWRFWPFVHTISFSHAVPLDLKLLWVDVMEVVWVTILSKVANEDKVAQLEANPALQAKDVSDEIPEVDPALEIELTREAELVVVAEGQPAGQEKSTSPPPNLAFELPQKVLAACWPLIVMWPVLYAGYQVEKFLGLEV